MVKLASIVIAVFVVGGCVQSSKSSGPADDGKASHKPTAKDVTTLVGPGGKVGIGDTVDVAKKAFPAPAGAPEFRNAMSFAIITKDGWAWASGTAKEGFEAATKGGKIVGLARTGGDASGEPAKTIALIGEPTRKAEGKTITMYVWEAGDQARFWLHTTAASVILPVSSITLIGSKEDLKLLNYRYDDPDTFVKQWDASSEQANSPEMKRAFEDAKRKALEKQGAAHH